jgi:hypothetical protein
MSDYNDRANAQRMLGLWYNKVELSTPVVPMWTGDANNKYRGNFVSLPISSNPIFNAIGVTPLVENISVPNGVTMTRYNVEVVKGTGGWVDEFISASNSVRSNQMASYQTSLTNTIYTS